MDRTYIDPVVHVVFTIAPENEGGLPVLERGIVYGTTPEPSLETSASIVNNETTPSYDTYFQNLENDATYYVKGYAINEEGIFYSDQLVFKAPDLPGVSTTEVVNITNNYAEARGVVESDGGTSILARCFCWSTSPNPDLSNDFTSEETSTGPLGSSLYDLSPGTTYYIRAYAKNNVGVSYGEEISFKTLN